MQKVAKTPDPCHGQSFTAKSFRPWSAKVWNPARWRRERPRPETIAAYHHRLSCAAGPRNRQAEQENWGRRRAAFYNYRRAILAQNINHIWAAHWAPDFDGPSLRFQVAAALFEAAGMPGVTMAQIGKGESGLRPGSAGVDPGGSTVGYGILAVTSPFADAIVAKYGGYNQMLNPVRDAAAAAEIYRAQGIGAWYGTRFVTGANLHYKGDLDLTRFLGGLTYRQALHRRQSRRPWWQDQGRAAETRSESLQR